MRKIFWIFIFLLILSSISGCFECRQNQDDEGNETRVISQNFAEAKAKCADVLSNLQDGVFMYYLHSRQKMESVDADFLANEGFIREAYQCPESGVITAKFVEKHKKKFILSCSIHSERRPLKKNIALAKKLPELPHKKEETRVKPETQPVSRKVPVPSGEIVRTDFNGRQFPRSKAIVKSERIFIMGESDPFTGILYGAYKDGKRKYEYNYFRGLLHGEQVAWHKNGRLKFKQNWEYGKCKSWKMFK
ncbi:toxin-antitoxin system YwqK family antitoxin [Candidatus Riflebacteria bacterium]